MYLDILVFLAPIRLLDHDENLSQSHIASPTVCRLLLIILVLSVLAGGRR